MLKALLVGAIRTALKDPEVRAWLEAQLRSAIKQIKDELLPDLAALMPVFGASLIKEVFNQVPMLDNIGDSVADLATGAVDVIRADPDLAGLSEIIDLSEIAEKILGRFGL
jgi:hypothetical protein